MIVGAAAAGTLGALAGLVIGLRTYAPTALFAVVELGLPAAIAGGAVGGLVVGLLLMVRRWLARRHAR